MKLHVPGMSCTECIMKITKGLNEIGVNEVNCDLKTKDVSYDSSNISKHSVIKAIKKAGFNIQ